MGTSKLWEDASCDLYTSQGDLKPNRSKGGKNIDKNTKNASVKRHNMSQSTNDAECEGWNAWHVTNSDNKMNRSQTRANDEWLVQ